MGVDEVGRGCLAGPVVAGAVILPQVVDFERDPWLNEVADSKCVSPLKREELAPKIQAWALASAVGVASVEEIDSINIFHASHLAMERAAQAALEAVSAGILKDSHGVHALVDGKFLPKKMPCQATAIIKGDMKCLSIAAASILAKVWRDRRMAALDVIYPGYEFGIHKGYSTPRHAAALLRQGICEIHRKSFAPVAKRLAQSLQSAQDGSVFK